jgi:hypothetical protein
MRFLAAFLATWLTVGAVVHGATVTLAWDANTDGVTTGYRIRYSDTTPEANPRELDVGNVTQVSIPNLTAGLAYFFTAVAYDAAGNVSYPSNAVVWSAQDPPLPSCTFPTGNAWLLTTIVGKLNQTGSKGVGSLASITFLTQSPGSPIVYLAVRANGVDIPYSVTAGTDLHAVGTLWFSVPALSGLIHYSVYARNAAGCDLDKTTTFSQTLP